MLIFLIRFVLPLLVLAGIPQPQPAEPSSVAPVVAAKADPASVAHLPEVLQQDILAWRERLARAQCLKVVLDVDQTWANLHQLDASGSPKVVLRERFSVHSWMMPDSVWVVVFGYKGDNVDTSRPIFQEYWSARERTAWERVWDDATAGYRVRKYECAEDYGPTDISFGARGCTFAAVTESWLARSADRNNCVSLDSIALRRRPNLAMVPADSNQSGMWLDVFWETVARNQETAPNSLYRRNDFMLLARNEAGQPEVREWRTLVLADQNAGGKKPQQITGIQRYSYTFYDSEPAELKATRRMFVEDVERAVSK